MMSRYGWYVPKIFQNAIFLKFMSFILMLLLVSCHSHHQKFLFFLQPVAPSEIPNNSVRHLRVGIDAIRMPQYLDSREIMIMNANHQMVHVEHHEWVEPLSKNISQVMVSNLMRFLKGAFVTLSPWDLYFKPTCRIEVNVEEFILNEKGQSMLAVSWIVSKQKGKAKTFHAQIKSKESTQSAMNIWVSHMNQTLNILSHQIAMTLKHHC